MILDPFVRLHRIDENASGEVAPLLAYLRELAATACSGSAPGASRPQGLGRLRAGQALRGSSEFHAWGDSNLYLRRVADRLSLTIEHRAAPSPPSLVLELHTDGDALALRLAQSVTEPPPPAPASVDERITAALQDAAGALTVNELRHQCRVRNATLYERLTALTSAGRIQRSSDGYRIARDL